MRVILPILCTLLLALPAVAADDVKREGAKTLVDADRLLIREVQLALAQAHITRLQAEVQVKEGLTAIQSQEKRLTDLLETLKKQYACSECELAVDFTWVRKPAPSKPATSPAPEGGQPTTKE
jgi:hypothetical protein